MNSLALFWTVEAIINIISAIFMLIFILILVKRYKAYHNQAVKILIIGWTAMFLFVSLEAISYILYLRELWRWHNLLLYVMGFALLIWIDNISRDSIEPIKLVVYSVIVGLGIRSMVEIDNVQEYYFENGDPSFGMTGDLVIWIVFANIYVALWWVLITGKIMKSSPKYLKRYSVLLFIGSILYSIVPMILVALRITTQIPGIDMLPIMIGIAITSYIFVQKPQIGYILPFKAIKLAVVGSQNNLLLYLHKWAISSTERDSAVASKQEEIEDSLFSGLVLGISLFVKKSIQRGEVREITTDDAVLLIHQHKEHPILFVLLATKSTRALRIGFQDFIKSFVSEYSQYFYTSYNKSYYNKAFIQVDKSFPFVPYRDKIEQKLEQQITQQFEKHLVNEASICVSCKNIKNQEGRWDQMDKFIKQQTQESFSWEVCPTCKSQQSFLCFSYFDQIRGPTNLLTIPEGVEPEIINALPSAMDHAKEDFFLHTIGKQLLSNYIFDIPSSESRGRTIFSMVSYIHKGSNFYIEFSEKILKEIIVEILSYDKGFSKAFIQEDTPEYFHIKRILEKYTMLINEKMIEFYLS